MSFRTVQLAARLPFAFFAFFALALILPSAAASSSKQSAKPAAEKAAQQTLQDGIYKITFSAPDGQHGMGLIVVSAGAVNGGDPAYTYQGRVETDGGKIKAVIDVVRYDSKEISIFGPLDHFQLQLDGALQKDGKAFSASGAAASNSELRISLSGEQVRELR